MSVWDPTDTGTQPRGKQVNRPNGIWYTSVTGIWQTVWMEPVGAPAIESLTIVPDIDAGTCVRVTTVDQRRRDRRIARHRRGARRPARGRQRDRSRRHAVDVRMPNPKLWSPTHRLSTTSKSR